MHTNSLDILIINKSMCLKATVMYYILLEPFLPFSCLSKNCLSWSARQMTVKISFASICTGELGRPPFKSNELSWHEMIIVSTAYW